MIHKKDVNYHLPEQCCASCQHSYIGSYDDILCHKLLGGASVTEGGVCDLFEKEPEKMTTVNDVVVPPPWATDNTCNDCTYYSLEHGMCLLRGQPSVMRCKKYERERPTVDDIASDTVQPVVCDDIVIDTDGELVADEVTEAESSNGTCANCAYSAYNAANVPYCRYDDAAIENAEDSCDKWVLEGSVVIVDNDSLDTECADDVVVQGEDGSGVESDCRICCYSYYDTSGNPCCSCCDPDDALIDLDNCVGNCEAYSPAEVEITEDNDE